MASTTALSRKDKQVLQDFDNSVRGMPHFIICLASLVFLIYTGNYFVCSYTLIVFVNDICK